MLVCRAGSYETGKNRRQVMEEKRVKKVAKDDPSPSELLDRVNAMSRGRKIVLVIFIIWAVQAIPKWTVAIIGDGETSAAIMKFFITPR